MYDDELLRATRELLGMTPAELGEAIGIPAELLEVWEAGTTKPRAGLWRAILEYMATHDQAGRPARDAEAERPAPPLTREEYARELAKAANRIIRHNRAQRQARKRK